jgi:hypothetical protein
MFASFVNKWLKDFDEQPSRNKIIAFCANMNVDEEHKALLPKIISDHFENRKKEDLLIETCKDVALALKTAVEEAVQEQTVAEQIISEPQQSEMQLAEQSMEVKQQDEAPEIDEFEFVDIGVTSGKSMFVERRRVVKESDDDSYDSSESNESSSASMKMKESVIEQEMKSKTSQAALAPNPAEISAQAALSSRPPERELSSSKAKLLEMSLDDTIDIFTRMVEDLGETASDDSVMKFVKKINAFNLKGRVNMTVLKMYHAFVSGGEDAIKAIKENRAMKIVKKVEKQPRFSEDEEKPAKKAKTVTLAAPPAGYTYTLIKNE